MTAAETYRREALAELEKAEQVGLEQGRYHVARAQVYALLAASVTQSVYVGQP